MIQAELRQLFYDRLIAFSADEQLPISLPNIPFEKPKRGKYFLRAHTLPVAPNNIIVCGESRHQWFLQVDVCARDGEGDIKSNEYIDKIRSEVFPVNSKLVSASHSFKVMTPPSPAPAIRDDAWYHTPVSLIIETIH